MSSFLVNEKIILTNNSSNQDAFDRLRISEPNLLFNYDLSLGKLPFLINELLSASGATITFDIEQPTIDLKLTGSGITGKAIRQSFEYVPYQPGKSKLMLFSGVLEAENGGITGVFSRIGCFDSSVEKTDVAGNGNGLFFELGGENGKILNVVKRLNDIDTKVAKSDWNYDKFDGTGPSGLTINDFSKALKFAIDQEWLGTGRVRYGFVVNGLFRLGHSFNHFGAEAIQVPYTKTAKLPVRYEISSIEPQIATMRMLSSVVLSEGGFEPTGLSFSIGRFSGKTLTIDTGTNPVPLISLRLHELEPYNRKTLSLRKFTVLIDIDKSIQWDLYMLPDSSNLIGKSFVDVNTANSLAEYDVSATGITGSGNILLASGYGDNSIINEFNYDRYLVSALVNSSITGLSKVLCLCGVKLPNQNGADPTVRASLSWIEIT